MSQNNSVAVGIDLGTTYTAIAALDEYGRPHTLKNGDGETLTPSSLLFEGSDVIVGKEALKALATDANHVAQCAKRDLGMRVFHKVLAGRQFPPEALQAWILHKLRNDVVNQIGEFTQAVITVPAYFDEVRRKATQDAGYMAGIDVLDIINEPTAAAVAYGFQEGFLNLEGKSEKPQSILVYDLGGGTFDVTVMRIEGNRFIALATDGDVQLGGHDFDQRLVDCVAEEFIRQHGLDPREEPNTHGRLWRDCEDAKRTLSARQKASITCDYKGKAVRIEMTRDHFTEITQDLIDRTAFTTRQTLQTANLAWEDIDRILLVGGSSRIPFIQEMLTKLTGRSPEASVSPDEAVAHGAALHAGLILARHHDQPPRFAINNVNSHSLGVVGINKKTKRQRNAILIPRNSPLPVSARRVFKTQKAGQRSILVQIVEGESASPEECIQIGECAVRNLPPNLPADTSIEIRFRYEENGRLTVEVHIQGTNTKLQHVITRENSLTQGQLDSWRKYISENSLSVDGADK